MTSHLADQRSAYLSSAQDQPVDWYPWGPEPFARARSEGKPILLDIGADRWRSRSHQLLEALARDAAELGVFGAALLRAIDWAVHPPTDVVVVGTSDAATSALLRTARAPCRPRKVITLLSPDDPADSLPEAVRAMLDGESPRAYVCAGTECAAPVDTPQALAETLASFGVEA